MLLRLKERWLSGLRQQLLLGLLCGGAASEVQILPLSATFKSKLES